MGLVLSENRAIRHLMLRTYAICIRLHTRCICDIAVIHNHQQGSWQRRNHYKLYCLDCYVPPLFPFAFIISGPQKMSDSTSAINIAVIGGGLAGAVIANALLQYAHIDVHVYESAPEFSERGAAIGLAENAQHALKLAIGGSGTVDAMLKRAGAVIQASSRLVVVSSIIRTTSMTTWKTER